MSTEDVSSNSTGKIQNTYHGAASGITPYVIGAVTEARKNGLLTGCITSNPDTPLAAAWGHPIETIVSPKFVTGSCRMKSDTAHKMRLSLTEP